MQTDLTCSHCDKPRFKRDLCTLHYQRWQKYRDPSVNRSNRGVPAEDRFWAKVDKSGDCWLWTGAIFAGNGYGQFSPAHHVNVAAHRFSWELHNGPIPDGLLVCHHCDTPLCVRLDHLFLGTASDNMQDMIRKGRQNNVRAKRVTRTQGEAPVRRAL